MSIVVLPVGDAILIRSQARQQDRGHNNHAVATSFRDVRVHTDQTLPPAANSAHISEQSGSIVVVTA
jgi:hypothetical protein